MTGEAVVIRPKVTGFSTRALADFKRLPLTLRVVLFFLLVAFGWQDSLLGFNISGLAWVVPFAVSLLVLIQKFDKVSFPFGIWLPWVVLLLFYLLLVDPSVLDPRVSPLQRTLQLLCPLAVGMAVSTSRLSCSSLRALIPTMRRVACLLFLIILMKTGVILTGQLPDVTGLAPEAISGTLLCTFFVNAYLLKHRKEDLLIWIMLVTLPFIAVTRMAIAVCLLSFPLAFAPMRLRKRLFALGLIVVVALMVFYSPRIQKKMFYSGKGSLSDITAANNNFATSGRTYILARLSAEARERLWTGRGTGCTETVVYRITKTVAYPHNDWLLTLYDYGILGVTILIFCMLLTVVNALRQRRKTREPDCQILLLTGAAGFFPFCLMMLTDNVMVYASFYGNLHFALLGLGYASSQKQKKRLEKTDAKMLMPLVLEQS